MTNRQDKSFGKRIKSFPYFLLLIGIYPVFYLLNTNMGYIDITATGLSAAIAAAFSLLITGVSLLVFRPLSRAYLVSIVLNTAFFTYGHLFNLIDAKSIGGFLIGRHMLFMPLFLLVIVVLLLLILTRKPSEESRVREAANIIIIGLCLFQVVGIGLYQLSLNAQSRTEVAGVEMNQSILTSEPGPDIYYIIIDGLTSEDVIQKLSGGMEYSLPKELKARGFYLPECAFSNYGGTSISLASSMNLQYLDALGIEDEHVNSGENEPSKLYNLLHGNMIANYLRQQGYQYIAFRGFFPLNDFQRADYYFSFSQDKQGIDSLAERSFRDMFVRTTMLRLPGELLAGSPTKFSFVPQAIFELIAPEASLFSSRSYQWYQEHLYTFSKLETLPAIPGKKFVYAHFYTTHQPYVFTPDGSLLWPINEDNDGYLAAVQYTSVRILEVVDRILSESERPPVIIIQADHGFGPGIDRHKILNAYYLPGVDAPLYDTITPVNTFRLLLNAYFGEQYEYLPDIILRSEEGINEFVPMPASCNLN
jgi:hypothetical protein